MNNTRVLICINNLGVGGAERLVVDDINEMVKWGIDVQLLTLKPESLSSLAGGLKLPKENWTTIHFGSLLNVVSWWKVFKYISSLKQRKDTDFDRVYTHLWFTNFIMRVVCRCAGVKDVVAFEHNIYDSVKSERMYAADRFLQTWCKRIVAVSSAVKSSLVQHGIEENRITVVNNGIDVSKYGKLSPEEKMKLREKLGIGQSEYVFLSIGRLIHQKGMDVLIQAFAQMQSKAVLLIVGQGSEERVLKQIARDFGIQDRVRFLGVRLDVPELLAMCDTFVLASRYEGLGIVVLEAMASKKVVIVSDFEAGRDMITPGKQGLVVERENVGALAHAMNTVMSDASLCARLAEAALEKSAEFSIEGHVNKILSV